MKRQWLLRSFFGGLNKCQLNCGRFARRRGLAARRLDLEFICTSCSTFSFYVSSGAEMMSCLIHHKVTTIEDHGLFSCQAHSCVFSQENSDSHYFPLKISTTTRVTTIYCLSFLITEYMFEISSSYELLVDKVTSALTQSQSLEPLLYAFD